MSNSTLQRIAERFGDRYSASPDALERHCHTKTLIAPQPADGVVYAKSREDVVDLVRLCAKERLPIVPYGAGTSLEGQVNAPRGGISLDMSGMNAIREIAADDMVAVVEPGVTRETLDAALRSANLFFAVDPGANATLGGMVSTRASGTQAVRYGTMRENTLALEVVLPSGEVVHMGRMVRKFASGYDLVPLFVGAEGTLGVITEITLRVHPIPRFVIGGSCTFETVGDAAKAVIDSMRAGIDFGRIELLDALAIRAFNRRSNLGLPERPTLFFEFHGTGREATHYHADTFRQVASPYAASVFQIAQDEAERARIWAARKEIWWAIHDLFPGHQGVSTDVCVPISELAFAVEFARSQVNRLSLHAATVGHVGDGNFHVLVMVEPLDTDQVARMLELVDALNEYAIEHGGVCSGEHGVGQGKATYAAREHHRSLSLMRTLKAVLDPRHIMNPSKMFDPGTTILHR